MRSGLRLLSIPAAAELRVMAGKVDEIASPSEGTGRGLSISYDIVTQQHGGTISVESEVGAYTEFTIRLPRNS